MRKCHLLLEIMASTAKSLEDMLSSDVDESAVSALLGSLESQLSSPTTHGTVSDSSAASVVNNNHINSTLISDGTNIGNANVPAPQKLTSVNVSNINQTSTGNVIHNADITLKQAIVSTPRVNVSRTVVLPSSGTPVTVVANTNQSRVVTQLPCGTSSVQIKPGASSITNVNGSNASASNHQFIIQNGNASVVSEVISAQQKSMNSTQSAVPTPEPGATINSNSLPGSQLNQISVSSSTPDTTLVNNTTVLQNTTNVIKSSSVPSNVPTVISGVKQTIPASNVMTQVVSSQGNVLQGVQIVNMKPNSIRTVAGALPMTTTVSSAMSNIPHKTLAPRVVIGNPVRIAGGQQVIAARPSAPNAIQNTITLQPGMVRGTLLVKTENGQYQLVNVGPALNPSSNASNITGTTAYRLQGQTRTIAPQQLAVTVPMSSVANQVKVQQTIASSGISQSLASHSGHNPISMSQVRLHGAPNSSLPARPISYSTIASSLHHRPPHPSMPTRNVIINRQSVVSANSTISQPLSVQTSISTQASGPVSSSQMSPDTAKKKCTNFLSTLIRLAGDQPEQVAKNVKNLIQGLIDGIVNPEDFTVQLQKELHSSPQPCLVPFLKKSLPYLQHSLATKELSIQGVRPPPPGTVITLPSLPQNIPTIQLSQARPQGAATQQIKILSGGIPAVTRVTSSMPTRPVANQRTQQVKGGPTKIVTSISSLNPAGANLLQNKSTKLVIPAGKEKSEKRAFSSLRDDDDINDVAAMGGVNLVEESAKILAVNSELVGTQIRSCKDENFLFTSPLQAKVKKIASKFNLDDPSPDVISLISHAAQERLKNLVEKLGVIAEHRMENVKTDPKYEVTNNTRAQVKFLEELDKLERKRHEEEEREILLRAAKSRSKVEDPEQQKLKLKAKEMQRMELEEMRQREANTTALLAIGPRKKFKPDQSSNSANTSNGSISGSPGLSSRPAIRPRVKRVNMKDLLFLMEQEKELSKSTLLYKAFLK